MERGQRKGTSLSSPRDLIPTRSSNALPFFGGALRAPRDKLAAAVCAKRRETAGHPHVRRTRCRTPARLEEKLPDTHMGGGQAAGHPHSRRTSCRTPTWPEDKLPDSTPTWPEDYLPDTYMAGGQADGRGVCKASSCRTPTWPGDKLPDTHMARGQAAERPHGRGGRGRAEIAVVSAQLIPLDLREVWVQNGQGTTLMTAGAAASAMVADS